jgi:hypothetical protein
MPTRSSSPSHGNCVRLCGPWPRRSHWLPRPNPLKVRTPFAPGVARLSEETQPRCGVALDGVQRLQEPPRAEREAGTRRTQGRGTQPTESSVINRRLLLAPALPMDNVTIRGQHNEDNLTRIFTQLLTLEVISTLRLSRAWQRERSGRWKVSAAAGGSALTPVQQSDNGTELQSVPGLPRRTRWQWGLGMRAFPGTLRATPMLRSPRRGLREP